MSVNAIVHKPDDASAELPPPPYSREPRTSDTDTYGSINEEQVGLLSNTPPYPTSKQPNNRGSSDGSSKLLVSCIGKTLRFNRCTSCKCSDGRASGA